MQKCAIYETVDQRFHRRTAERRSSLRQTNHKCATHRRIIGRKNWSIAIFIPLFGTINILLRVRVKQHVSNVEQQEIRMQLDKMLLAE